MIESFTEGIAFILEGSTEKVFYVNLLEQLAKISSTFEIQEVELILKKDLIYNEFKNEFNLTHNFFRSINKASISSRLISGSSCCSYFQRNIQI